MTRYPLAPLARAARLDPHTPDLTAQLAERLHLTDRTIRRYTAHGLTALQADRAATRLHTHPTLIWPNWWPTHDGATTDPHWYQDDPPLETLLPLAC